jgi:hypothetical protein
MHSNIIFSNFHGPLLLQAFYNYIRHNAFKLQYFVQGKSQCIQVATLATGASLLDIHLNSSDITFIVN